MITRDLNDPLAAEINEQFERRALRKAEGIGVDLNTKLLAIAAVGEGEVVATLAFDLPEGRVARAYTIAAGVREFVSHFDTLRRVSVEIPFFTQNVNTGKVLHELASAAAIGAYSAILDGIDDYDTPPEIEYVDNNKWKSYIHGTSRGIEKTDTKTWAHKQYSKLVEIPDFVKVISRGKRKGHEDRKVSDVYDAIALAAYAARRDR